MIFIPLSIAAEFRIIYRIIVETLKGLKRTGLINFVIIGTMAAILSIFGCLFKTSLAISSFVHEFGNNLQISVYLKPDTNPNRISKQIYNYGYIKNIDIISKQQAWKELKSSMEVPDITNPLPDTLHVQTSDQKYIERVARKIKLIGGVEGVQYEHDLADKVQQVGNMTNVATFIVLIFLGGLTLFIISNTIHLVIQARKQEIEIMRMMGVSNWYIRAPYILQGEFYGLSGSLISLIPLNFLQNYLAQLFNFFQITVPTINTNIVIFSLLMMGVLVGSGGSIISVKKYLKV